MGAKIKEEGGGDVIRKRELSTISKVTESLRLSKVKFPVLAAR